MVVNIGDVKNGLYDKVEEEIRELKKVCGDHILKVIIETCYLTKEEKIAMCRAVTAAGADYIKTSTGFGTGGATREDVDVYKRQLVLTVLLNLAIKGSFMRVRPPEELRLVMETGYSFPSGHAMVAASFYGFLIFMLFQASKMCIRDRSSKGGEFPCGDRS